MMHHCMALLLTSLAFGGEITFQFAGLTLTPEPWNKEANFAKLAKSESKDPVSAANGGELDWFARTSMVKPFGDAVAGLQVGEVTAEPVQTQFGWHVIQLEEVRSATPPDFESVKDRVKGLVQQKKFQAHLDEVRKTAKIQKS